MANASRDIEEFLTQAGWGAADRQPLAGDASARRYWRLKREGEPRTSVLMVAGTNAAENLRAFVKIGEYLREIGLSAPSIIAKNIPNGLLLLEDLGDLVFARVLEAEPKREPELYRAAVEVLEHLHSAVPPDGMTLFSTEVMARQAGLVYPCYVGAAEGQAAFQHELETLLTQHFFGGTTLLLRDYHAENLVWLPDRDGVRRVGLLDFQDAMIGPPGYDLASLLHDVRRNVPTALAKNLGDEFAEAVGLDRETFTLQRALLSVQRNLRILGVFARLSKEEGKSGYIDLVPRVWGQLVRALDHPALADLAARIHADLPEPDAAHLNRLREPCALSRP